MRFVRGKCAESLAVVWVCRKAYLDQLVSDAKMEVKPTAKTWEPLRAYEKKLVSIMHKGTRLRVPCVRS